MSLESVLNTIMSLFWINFECETGNLLIKFINSKDENQALSVVGRPDFYEVTETGYKSVYPLISLAIDNNMIILAKTLIETVREYFFIPDLTLSEIELYYGYKPEHLEKFEENLAKKRSDTV